MLVVRLSALISESEDTNSLTEIVLDRFGRVLTVHEDAFKDFDEAEFEKHISERIDKSHSSIKALILEQCKQEYAKIKATQKT